MRTIYDGEKRYIGVTVSRSDGESFTIESATCEVRDLDGSTVISSDDATVDGADVYRLIDSTASGVDAGNRYHVYFTISITGNAEVVMGKVELKVVD